METIGDLAPDGVGYLDMRDYNRARWAWELSHPASGFMIWLRDAGHVSFAQDDVRVTGSSDPSIPIPATKLAYLEVLRISNLLNSWADIESAAHHKIGASHLLDLSREVGAAYNRWPDRDKPHKISSLVCGGCERLTLIYRPPRAFEDEIKIDCWAADCDWAYTEADWDQFIKELKIEHGIKD